MPTMIAGCEMYVRYACAAHRRAQCECTFEAGEIVAVIVGIRGNPKDVDFFRRVYCNNEISGNSPYSVH